MADVDKKKDELRKKFEKGKAAQKKKYKKWAENLYKNQIRFELCKIGYTYEIDARNFKYAIFYNDKFYGIRHKFHDEFIDAEIHWDKDDRFGTARPQKEIEKTPDDVLEALKYHEEKGYDEHTVVAFNVVKKYLDEF
jgi:hypothetical protein